MENLAGIIILIIFLLFTVSGYNKGILRMFSGVMALVISTFLVNFLLPYVTETIRTQTPVYTWISEQCSRTISTEAVEAAIKKNTSGNKGYNREQIKSLLGQYGLDVSQVDYLSDSELKNYIDQYLSDYMPAIEEGAAGALSHLTKIEQTQLIQQLPIPGFLQKMMISYNNSEGYRKLNVTDFGGYVVGFVSSLILNIVAFVATLLLTWLIVWIFLTVLNVAAHIPGIYQIDRVGGALLGGIKGLFFVWLLFLVISAFSGTAIGIAIQNMIDQSLVLKPMYEANLLLKVVSNALQNIL